MVERTRLPSRFPVGTHYILEGQPGPDGGLRITSHYVLMPDGSRYDLMDDVVEAPRSAPTSARKAPTKARNPGRPVRHAARATQRRAG